MLAAALFWALLNFKVACLEGEVRVDERKGPAKAGPINMSQVFIVWSHVEHEECKLIGVYTTEQKARDVVRLYQDDSGPVFFWDRHRVDVDPLLGE